MAAPAGPAAYESAGDARERLTALTAVTLGGQLADRARAEAAWPALIAALRRAENAGYDPADALTRTATARELRTARSVSEVLAWRINRHLAAHSAAPVGAGITPNDTVMTTESAPVPTAESTDPAGEQDQASARQPEGIGSAATRLLPWVPAPRQGVTDGEAAPLAAYLGDAAALITARFTYLADNAIRLRPPWTSVLGQQPTDPDAACEWGLHIGVIAAYRDQHKITTDDPRQVLGPYAETGSAGHRAYWHAAESVLAARRLAGLEPATEADSAGSTARAQLAADVYRNLPDSEREAITAAITAIPGAIRFGDPNGPHEHAVAQSAYTASLSAALARRGHMTIAPAPARIQPEHAERPIEADLARRGRGTRRGHTTTPVHEPARRQRLESRPRHTSTGETAPRPRPAQ
jgi:hypothetical protein